MPVWRDTCARSADQKHHWGSFKQSHVRGVPKYTENFGRRILSHVVIIITCRYCLFSTRAVVDFVNREVRVGK